MKKNPASSRRKFLQQLAVSAAAVAAGTKALANETPAIPTSKMQRLPSPGANDNIHIGLIGAGGMGTQDTLTALKVHGVKLVAVCDLYDGRLKEAKSH